MAAWPKGDCDYTSDSVAEAFCKVLCTGRRHYEQCNAYTHAFAAVAVAALMLFVHSHPFFASGGDTRVALSRASGWLNVATFVISTLFHVLRTLRPTKRECADVGLLSLLVDQLFVVASLTMSVVANTAAWISGVRTWKTLADGALAGGLCALFLVVRHAAYEKKQYKHIYQHLDTCRAFPVDGLHRNTHAAANVCLVLAMLLPLPNLYKTLSDTDATAVLFMAIVSAAFIVTGQALESGHGTVMEEMQEHSLQKNPSGIVSRIAKCMHVRNMVMTGHAVWHVLAMFSVLLDILQREIAGKQRTCMTVCGKSELLARHAQAP